MDENEVRENQDDELRRLIRLRQDTRNAKLTQADVGAHAFQAFNVTYDESKNHTCTDVIKDMNARFRRTFGDNKQPATTCCNHCIN